MCCMPSRRLRRLDAPLAMLSSHVRVAMSECRVEVVETCGPPSAFMARTYLVKRVYRTNDIDASL